MALLINLNITMYREKYRSMTRWKFICNDQAIQRTKIEIETQPEHLTSSIMEWVIGSPGTFA